MDFFARQDASRRSTRRLVGLFGLAFLAVALATAFVVAGAIGLLGANGGVLSVSTTGRIAPGLGIMAVVALITLALMVIASLYRTATLASGGGQVATMLGGTRIHGDETDPRLRRLINVVEEMAIASGLPVPEVYVLEQEHGINAFAAGLEHGDAAIAVTRGSLEQLSRAELQGVIAHEFSHILNGDMRLNVRLMGFSFGILVLSLIGRWLLRSSRFARVSRSRRGGGGIVMIGLGLTVIGWIGVFLSRLIKAAVSRQREALADASAVQFTREPLALAGALKKIGGFTTYLTATDSEEVSHMLFGRGAASFRGWFATHPPLEDRIRALDPAFEPGDYPAPVTAVDAIEQPDERSAVAAGLAGSGDAGNITTAAAGSIRDAGTARALLGALPESLYAAAHSPADALLLVVALALDTEGGYAGRQTSLLQARLGERRASACLAFRRELERIDRRLWLPLVEVAVPALKRRPASEVEFLFDLIQRLAQADAHETLFEFALIRLLRAYLAHDAHRHGHRQGLKDAWLVTLATIARHGHTERQAARAALAAGLAVIPNGLAPRDPGAIEVLLDRSGLAELDTALTALAGAPARARRDILASVEATIRHDGHTGIEESELLRAIGATLGCPIPPARAMS